MSSFGDLLEAICETHVYSRCEICGYVAEQYVTDEQLKRTYNELVFADMATFREMTEHLAHEHGAQL